MFSFYWLGFKKILGVLKKVLIVFVVYIIVISLFFYFSGEKKSYNQKNVIDNYRTEIYRTINDPELNKNEAGKIAINIYRNLLCGLIGEACTNNPADGDKNFDHSLFGFATKLITLPASNPPASASYWVYSGLINAGFIPKTYAAAVSGIGLASLAPILTIWVVFRNLFYILFVLLIIAIGFMIMFRMKINPQTVITIENSLPKIVIALILITFSLPIAGFLIDVMYIVCGMIIIFFENQISLTSFKEITEGLYKGIFVKPNFSLMDFFIPFRGNTWDLAGKVAHTMYILLPNVLKDIIHLITYVFVYKIIGLAIYAKTGQQVGLLKAIGSIIAKLKDVKKLDEALRSVKDSGTLGASIVAALLTFIIFLVESKFFDPYGGTGIIGLTIFFIKLILLVSLLFTFVRIFFMLLYSYIQTIIFIIFSPAILAFEAIPGKSTFSGWLKTMIYHLSTWPLLIVILLINQSLMLQIENTGANFNIFLPPFLDIGNTDIIYLISAVLLFLTPDIIKNLKELMGLKPQDIGISLGAVFTGGAAGGGFMQLLSQYQTISMVTGWNPIARALSGAGKAAPPQVSLNPETQKALEIIAKNFQPGGTTANQPQQGGNS